MIRRFGGVAAWVFVLSSLVGCSDDDDSLANVSGQVFFYGAPAQAEIIFEPVKSDGSANGRPSTAFTDADGRYTLFFTADRQGVAAGRHHVSIKIYRWQGGGDRPSRGAAAAAIKTAHLLREVAPGNSRFDFFMGF